MMVLLIAVELFWMRQLLKMSVFRSFIRIIKEHQQHEIKGLISVAVSM
jgi:hypothetical protein